MTTYIYFVKCPGCEDEHFDFFDEAKEFALSCLSQKPIITQTEVCRNDFGECTDSADLGTVWSWEDLMKDTTDAEPAVSIFTKDDLECMNRTGKPCCDTEFDNLDNSVDFEPEIQEVPDNFRKPIPEGMTLEQLVEEMEENEDTVECTWCNDLFDKSECRYEVDLGWLCSRCEMAIKSRGETLTFREGSYWDFLDEDITAERSIGELVRDSINHLVNDLGKDSTVEDFADDVILDIERNYDNFVPEDPMNHIKWASAIASEVSRQLNNPDNLTEASLSDIAAAANSEFGTSWDADYLLDKAGVDDEFSTKAKSKPVSPKARSRWALIKPNPPIEVPAELIDCVLTSDKSWAYQILQARHGSWYNKGWQLLPFEDACKKLTPEDCERARHMDEALTEDSVLEELEPTAGHDLGNEYDGGYPAESPELPEEDEIPEVSNSHLKLCPECGENTFDTETGICIECGFN